LCVAGGYTAKGGCSGPYFLNWFLEKEFMLPLTPFITPLVLDIKHLLWSLFVRCNFRCSGLWFYLPSEIHVCCCLLGRTKIAISQPCVVRLSWNLVETWRWYPRLACMFWFQDWIIFYIVNKQKNEKPPKSRFYNLHFLRRSKSDWSETWWGQLDKY
jgi:hypothetical protein